MTKRVKAKPAKKIGRPSKYTPELLAGLMADFEAGTPVRIACDHAGISEPTYYRWCSEFQEFREAVTRARAGGIVASLNLVKKAGFDDWRAAAEHLKLAFPEYFATRVSLRVEEKTAIVEQMAEVVKSVLESEVPDANLRERVARAIVQRGVAALGDEGAR